MSDPETWHRRQLDEAEELLDQGQQALHHGNLPAATDRVDEALVILDMARAEEFDDDVRRLRARGLNDRGLLYQQSEELELARDVHRRAAELVDAIDEVGGEFAASAAAIYLNLAQVALFEEDFERAREVNESAMELVEGLDTETTRGAEALELNVYQNKTALESFAGDFEAADAAAERAIALAEGLADEGRADALGQAARVAQQLSVQLFENDRNEEALEWGRRAEELSERTYEHVGQEALHLYIVSEINLISFYEEQHQFANAEDCLWKAIEVAGPDPELVERGQVFYEQCRKFADERLEEGNLPRDEVEMGYEDLQDVMQEHGLGYT